MKIYILKSILILLFISLISYMYILIAGRWEYSIISLGVIIVGIIIAQIIYKTVLSKINKLSIRRFMRSLIFAIFAGPTVVGPEGSLVPIIFNLILAPQLLSNIIMLLGGLIVFVIVYVIDIIQHELNSD